MKPMKAPHPDAAAYTAADFSHSPFIVFYETTRACDLACAHCRASAQKNPHPLELKDDQAFELMEQLAAFPKKPLVVFTGGDPLKRESLYDIIAHGRKQGLHMAITPSATPLVTRDALRKMKDSGIARIAISLDAPDAETHDAFRRVDGSFQRTMEIMDDIAEVDLPMQINTTVTRRNIDKLDDLAEMLAEHGTVLWSVFFLVPVGRGLQEERITPEQYEQVFERLWHYNQTQPYAVKTTEAHHYRRYVLQEHGNPLSGGRPGQGQRAPLGVNDGKGVMFISHTGMVYPSGFMPIRCGKFPKQNIAEIYQDSPIFQSLRNPDGFKGKCGVCEFRQVCGGSRARAYALTKDPLESEPDCIYRPKAWTGPVPGSPEIPDSPQTLVT